MLGLLTIGAIFDAIFGTIHIAVKNKKIGVFMLFGALVTAIVALFNGITTTQKE